MTIWNFLGGPTYGLVTLAFLLAGSGAFAYASYEAGKRRYDLSWKSIAWAYAGAVGFIVTVARGVIAMFGG